MEYFKRKLKDKSAQDMIEFTFVLPLLLFCFVFTLTSGQMVYDKFVAFEAVFNGTRQACTETSRIKALTTMRKVVEDYNDQTIGVDKFGFKLYREDGGSTWVKNEMIVGEVVYTIKTLFPINFVGYGGYEDMTVANKAYVTARTVALIEYDETNKYDGSKH